MSERLNITVVTKNADARAFCNVLDDVLDALDAIATEQGKNPDWQIISLQKNSPMKVVLASQWAVFMLLVFGMKKIEDGKPNPLNSNATKAVKRLGKRIENDTKVIFEPEGQPEFQPTAQLFRNAQQSLSRGFYMAQGSIDGTLDIVNVHTTAKFSIFDDVDHREIRCKFPDELLEAVKRNIGKRIIAAGIVKYRANDDLPVSIQVETIESLDDAPPLLFSEMSPIDLAGAMSSEQYIRQLRDGQ